MAELGTVAFVGGTLALPASASASTSASASASASGRERATRFVAGDLQIEDGVITHVGHVVDPRGERVDAHGLLVMPGAIDPQVHFREPGATHKEDIGTGSRACAAGGITSFLEMPNTQPTTTDAAQLDWKHARAAETSLVNWGFYVGATPDNTATLTAMARRDDVPGIKIFMGSSTGSLLVSERSDLETIFAAPGLPIAVHAEDEARLKERIEALAGGDVSTHPQIRDAETARRASALALELSRQFSRRLHILHLTTAEEVALLRAERVAEGRVSAEVTPQHLLLCAPDVYERLGTLAQMNPPLRTREHSEALWTGLHEGLIDCIATDHAPHTLEEKAAPYGQAPSGMPGVETSLAALLDAADRGLCRAEQVVHWMTDAPARVWRIRGKGRLEVGFDGDVALVDLAETRAVDDRPIRSRCGWNPFAGMRLRGWPVATFVAGVAVYRDGELLEASAARRLRFQSGSGAPQSVGDGRE